jgi:predicted DNA-binding transcriptional regulator AlpA
MIVTSTNKNECVSMDEATNLAKVSRATLYNYMNVLGVQRFKFPFDRKTYILKSDLENVKAFIEKSRG